MKSSKEMEKGEIEARYFDRVCVVKWIDVKPVMMMSAIYSGKKKLTIVKKRQKSKAEKAEFTVPAMVDKCNKRMRGTGLFDHKATVYAIDRKSLGKYYRYCRPFWNYIDVSLSNEHIIYKNLINELPSSNSDGEGVVKTQKDFCKFVALELIGNFSSRKQNPGSTRCYRDSLIQRRHIEFVEKHEKCKRCYQDDRQDRKVFIKCVDCCSFA